MLQRFFQFEAAAADITEIVAKQVGGRRRVNGRSRLFNFLLVDQNFSGEDERLRAFSRRRQTPLHQQFVETRLQGLVTLTD